MNSIEKWHQRARPNPTPADFDVQLGCHCEEFVEMLETLLGVSTEAQDLIDDAIHTVKELSKLLKNQQIAVLVEDRKELLDALADQIVTSVGVGHCAGMNVPEALARVDLSNWSKMVDGEFERDANGKVTKSKFYVRPNLEGLY